MANDIVPAKDCYFFLALTVCEESQNSPGEGPVLIDSLELELRKPSNGKSIIFEARHYKSDTSFHVGCTGQAGQHVKTEGEVFALFKAFLGSLYPALLLLETIHWKGSSRERKKAHKLLNRKQDSRTPFLRYLAELVKDAQAPDKQRSQSVASVPGGLTRKGAAIDGSSLKKLFAGHTVMELKDFTLAMLRKFIDEDIKRELGDESKQYKFLVFYLGSHGGEKMLDFNSEPPGQDNYDLQVKRNISINYNFALDVNSRPILAKEDIFEKFSAMDFNGYLEGIPMLFLMAFCRGEKINTPEIDSACFNGEDDLLNFEEALDDSMDKPLALVNKADKIIYFATVDGHVSYRDPERGTWMIQEFVKTAKKHPNDCFSTILTKTNQTMARKSTGIEGKHYQVPLIRHTLRKDFLFTSKEELAQIEAQHE